MNLPDNILKIQLSQKRQGFLSIKTLFALRW